ncbi:MAG: YCF48-related protein, partial [Bacteroidota bacterium]
IFFTHPDTGWIVGDMGRILRTTDGGTTWDPVPSPTLENLRRVMFTSVSTGTAVGDNGVILRTTDGGNTWDQQNSGLGSDLTSVFFVDNDNGMVTGERGLVIATMNGGVPVELSAFSAIALNDGAVELRWQTETEEQNFGFDVERDAGAGWESMGFIAGSGDSKIAHRYSFVDRRPFDAESLLYRLRQRDYDGGWEYSPVIMFKREVHPFSPALFAWPNPFHSSTNLQLTLPQASTVRLRIYDSDGRLCATIQEAAMEAGTHILPWQADGFASGRYTAVMEADGFRRITDLVFQK